LLLFTNRASVYEPSELLIELNFPLIAPPRLFIAVMAASAISAARSAY